MVDILHLLPVQNSYPIGTVEIIMPNVTEGNDIPIGSIADGSNAKEEHQMSTDGQQSEEENSEESVLITGDVVQSPQHSGSTSKNCQVPHEGSMAQGTNGIPESEVSSQQKPQNADETMDYFCDESVVQSNALASDTLHSNMDNIVNTSTELGEGSDTSVPEQNVHSVSKTEMQKISWIAKNFLKQKKLTLVLNPIFQMTL